MRRSTLLAAFLAALALGSGTSSAAAEQPTREYQIKAAFLYSFAKFVTWPAEALPEPSTPIVIGVLGEDPIGGELRKVVAGRTVNQHPVLVKDVGAADASHVHLLFVAAADSAAVSDALAALATRPVLTVADTPAVGRLGTIVAFSLEDERVRFSLDGEAARRAGLEVSSQLQKLAKKPAGK